MKFTCTQENFARGLHVVARAASKNIALPILNNVLLVAENGVIRLLTTNLEVAVTTQIRAKVDVTGRYTVNSRLLSEYISTLKGSKVSVAVADDGLIISTDQAETTIKGLPADEFPVLPVVEAKTDFTVPTGLFRAALEETLFAAANDESRPEISGLFLGLEQDAVTLAATDSHRLSERKLKTVSGSATKLQAILPARACQEILRILEAEEEATNIRLDDKQAMVRSGETEVVTRLIEGQYPDYQQIIPTKHETTVRAAKEELLDAVKAASLFSQPGINDIALTFDTDGKIHLSAASAQSGHHAATVAANITGPKKEVVFNYRYLLDGIQSLTGDEVVIELGDPQTPGVLRGGKDRGEIYLIMPILQ